jgi:hypothetical protein
MKLREQSLYVRGEPLSQTHAIPIVTRSGGLFRICTISKGPMAHGMARGESKRTAHHLEAFLTPVECGGICFTYATMFALEALSLNGETYATSKSARRACDFLVEHQMKDGGWGETYMVSVALNVFPESS